MALVKLGRARWDVTGKNVGLDARGKETFVTWWQRLGTTVACSDTGHRKVTCHDLAEEAPRGH